MKITKELATNIAVVGVGGIIAYRLYCNHQRSKNNPEEIEKVIQNWLDTVCKHNPQAIVDLYAKDGVLLGTVAKTMKVGRERIAEYFNMFVEKKPCGVFTEVNIQNFGSDYAIADGTYDFTLLNDEGEKDVVSARYTFAVRKIDGVWKIATHHSSVNPE
jgi:uncharacterized protein (TIGR02246 family)